MKHNYVDNKTFFIKISEFVNEIKEIEAKGGTREDWPQITNYLGDVIYKMACALATKGNFSGYSFKDEMIGDAVENCFLYINKFNPDKSNNPFAYFTTIIYNAFLRRIAKEAKQQYIRQKSMLDAITMNTLVDMHPDDFTHFSTNLDFDSAKYQAFVDKFEKKADFKPKKKGLELFVEEDLIDESEYPSFDPTVD